VGSGMDFSWLMDQKVKQWALASGEVAMLSYTVMKEKRL
jgi:hypothetical protein